MGRKRTAFLCTFCGQMGRRYGRVQEVIHAERTRGAEKDNGQVQCELIRCGMLRRNRGLWKGNNRLPTLGRGTANGGVCKNSES